MRRTDLGWSGYHRPIVCSANSLVLRVLVGGALVGALTACSSGDDGEPVIDLGPTAVGTCLDFDDSIGAEVDRLPEVPCEDPHSHEIFAVKLSAADTYPGFEALEADAQAQCLGAFDEYVGISAFDSELFFSWLVPTLTSWDKENDREIVCVIGEGNGADLVGTVRGIAR